jgi:phosphatidylglycerophosphate synthase
MTRSWWRLPDAPLRSSVVRALAAGLLVSVALASSVALATGAGAAFVVGCAAAFTVGALLVAGRVGSHHPFDRFGPANLVTLVRLSLLTSVAGLIGEPPAARVAWAAVGVTIVSAALDGIDGRLARRHRMSSPFGARFDMETDALLILVLSVLVWWHEKAGAWVLACGSMRYAFVAAGWVLPWLAAPLRSTLRGKTVAVLQVVGLAVALLPLVAAPASAVIAAATLGALIWSFAIDVAFLWRQSA